MSRDNVSSEQNEAYNEEGANEETEQWKEIKKNLSRAYGKADKEGRFGRFKKHELKIIPWEKPQKRSHLMMKALSGIY